jgi:uncharacterized protein (TIGR02266 family)
MTQPLSLKASHEPEPISLRFRFDSETVEQFAERYASDVSRGGIFVHSRQPFPVGTQLRLDLQLLNGTPLIVGDGTVHWTREPDPNKPAQVPGMGIRFSKLSGRSQQIIEAVLSQRTGRERTGLFSTISPTMTVEESGRILSNSSSKSKLPFNVFPNGRPHDPNKGGDDRELLANAGREEATPLVGVSAALMSDARPGKDESGSKTPAPAAPVAEVGSGPASASGSAKRPPPALALIKPGAAPIKETEHKLGESGRVLSPLHRSSSGMAALPKITTTQELSGPSGSTPPASVQGEPALGASQSGVRPAFDAGRIPSVRPPMRNKLIIGAAALLAVTITVFATTRKGSVNPSDTTTGAHAPAATATVARTTNVERPAPPAIPTPAGTAPTEAASEGSSAPALEPEPAAATPGGKAAAASRVADRRAPKAKPASAHRAGEVQSASRSSAPSERPPVAEAPARVEAPAPPALPPPPAPVAVVHEAAPAPRAVTATAPPPVASVAHKLRMTSIPSEAEVELDGRPIGRTPLFGVEIDVSRPHTLVVHKDGYAPYKQTVSSSSEWSMRSAENTATLRVAALMKKIGAP